jgi:DNA helicase IV
MQLLEELSYAGGSATKQLQEVRNRTRYGTNTSNRNSISRTLLVKGQEYDECIILGADGMSARNLYVALSRGIDKVTVFSSQPVITIANY